MQTEQLLRFAEERLSAIEDWYQAAGQGTIAMEEALNNILAEVEAFREAKPQDNAGANSQTLREEAIALLGQTWIGEPTHGGDHQNGDAFIGWPIQNTAHFYAYLKYSAGAKGSPPFLLKFDRIVAPGGGGVYSGETSFNTSAEALAKVFFMVTGQQAARRGWGF